MIEIRATVNLPEKESKRLFGMRIFRTKTVPERKGSLDSSLSPTSSTNSVEETQRRKSSIGKLLRRQQASKTDAIQVSAVPADPKKLRKGSTNFPAVNVSEGYQRDKQTGEVVVDHTNLLHSLVHQESTDSIPKVKQFKYYNPGTSQSGEVFLSRLPLKIWPHIFDSLALADKASLSLTCKAFRQHLVSYEAELELPENQVERQDFLLRLDYFFPEHLFCFACSTYHRRLNPRKESLKPSNVANPLFTCPHAQSADKRISRVRVTSGRTLPFTFVQLALRAHHHSADHGISVDSLSRRCRDRDNRWNHQTRYAIIDDHLLVRITSTSFAAPGLPPAGLRNLLYNPQEEFHPYFSTCPHWRDGELMPMVKCAISHIPKPIEGSGLERVGKEIKARYGTQQSSIITLCNDCRPMRRCPECPTEYLVEIKMAEDKAEPDPTKVFKQALVVTRWSDLGDGSSPLGSKEWAACTGVLHGFDSFAALGKRAISGIFESHFTADVLPGQKILNMNPNKEKQGEKGHKWY